MKCLSLVKFLPLAQCLLVFSLFGIATPGLVAAAERIVLLAGGSTEAPAVGTSSANALPAAAAKLTEPFGVDADRSGNLYLIEMTGHRLSRITPEGNFEPLLGNGKPGGGGDAGDSASEFKPSDVQFNGPHALLVSKTGQVYIADTWNHRIRRFDPKTGKIYAFAGTSEKGFGGDGGPARDARFNDPYCLAFDADERHMLVADLDNRRIRSIDMETLVVNTVAGNGEKGVPKDDAIATQSPLVDPRAVAADKQGNIYILERGGHALRVVDAAGKIRTVAGTGQPGLAGDGGDALQAKLNGPKHLYVDASGNVLIADTETHTIRRYDPKTGKIARVAGTGKKGNRSVGTSPLELELNRPHGVYVTDSGAILISDSSNGRVLKIEAE